VQRAKVLELGEDIVRTPEQAFLIATQQALRDGTESTGTPGNNSVPSAAQVGDLALVKEIRLNRHNLQVQQFLQLLHSQERLLQEE